MDVTQKLSKSSVVGTVGDNSDQWLVDSGQWSEKTVDSLQLTVDSLQ